VNCSFSLKVYESRHDIADQLTEEFFKIKGQKEASGSMLNAAFSGGSTPSFLFKALSNEAKKRGDNLSGVRFFWVDERCVPPDSEESNYNQLNTILFSALKVPEENIFRILGEKIPEKEAVRYSKIMYDTLPLRSGFPVFDLLFLGVGNDGHTASLFPMSRELDEKEKAAVVSVSPQSGRKRITLTLPVICNADRIIFLVTGADKREIVRKLCKHGKGDPSLPASLVKSQTGSIEWYVDSVAWSSWEQDSDVF